MYDMIYNFCCYEKKNLLLQKTFPFDSSLIIVAFRIHLFHCWPFCADSPISCVRFIHMIVDRCCRWCLLHEILSLNITRMCIFFCMFMCSNCTSSICAMFMNGDSRDTHMAMFMFDFLCLQFYCLFFDHALSVQ